MPGIWILSANGASATIYSADSPTAALVKVASLEHPEGRSREKELSSDRPGRTFDRFAPGRCGSTRGCRGCPPEPAAQRSALRTIGSGYTGGTRPEHSIAEARAVVFILLPKQRTIRRSRERYAQ